MKEPCGDAENMKSDLLKSMQSLLTEFAPSRSENNQKLKTPSCNLEEIFKDKATHFKKLTQEMGHWDSVCTQALTGRFETSKCCECDHTWNVDLKPGVDSQCEGDIENQWQFVKISLQSLLLLDMLVSSELKSKVKVQNKQQHKPNVLGAKDLKIVAGVLQLVLTYGVWPCLLKGIGKPLSNTLPTQLKPVKEENRIKLKVMLQSLLILIKNKEFCSQVLPLCLGDIISGLVQLGYEPLKAVASGNCHPICKHERSWCKEQLNDFIRSSYQPIIIKELMVLQKCAVNSRLSSIKWFLRCLGDHLSCCLMYDNGVINVIIAILDGMPDQVEWIHYDSIGKVISRPPQKLVTPVQYYQKIGPQLLQLLAHKQGNQHHLMISISTICQIYQLHPSMCLENLIDPLVKPLADFHNTEKLTMDSDELISTLASLSNLICTKASIIPEQLMLFLSRLIPILFVVNALEIEPLQTFRSKIKETIATICQKNPTKHVTELLFQALFNKSSQHSQDETLVINPGLTINLIERISDSTKNCKTHLVCELHTEMKIDCFVELLRNEEMSGHRGDLFVALLQQMIRNVQLTASKEETLSTVSTSGKKEPSKPNTSLLNIDANLNLLKFNIELISTISAMMDSFGHSVLQNTPQIVAFIKSVLDLTQDTKVCISEDSFHENTVDLALMLLSTLLASNKLSNADFESLSTLVPSLDETSRSHGNTSSRAMANDVKTFISTRGSVNANSYTQKPQRGTTENSEDNLTSERCYTKALDELLDPLLPTRGHALRQLSKLLKHKNTWALKDEEKLFEIFETNLRHDDTYLYLAAVDCLMTLVDVRHDVVLPLLCRRFIDMKTNELDMTASHNRMKLCEAIIRSLPICGEILPIYKDLLMNALSCGVLDEDEFIRASSLSGIGELCHLLKFSIGSLIVEVFSCINHVVSTDKSIEVRKAGVQVVALLLKGVDTALLQTIPNELLPIYRWLKLMKISEKDEMTSLHVDNALTILDEIMKELMTPRTLITQINM